MKVKIESMKLQFYNANRSVVDLSPLHGADMMIDHKRIWEETYGVKIIQGPWGEWDEIEFRHKRDYTMFMLRWS